MTFRDPPRLRTRADSLARELALALERSHEEEATPEELEQLAASVRRELETCDRKSLMLHRFPRRRAPLGRTLAFVATFALGAGAGVLVSGGVVVATRPELLKSWEGVKPAASVKTRAPARRERPAPTEEVVVLTEPEAPAIPSADPAEQRPRATPAPPASAGESTSASAAEELALLNRAQASLGRDPAMSLMLVSDHQRRFRPGTLVQEREVIAIDALLRLGQRPAAEARAARFRQQFPASVHRRRVDVLLGVGSSSASDHN